MKKIALAMENFSRYAGGAESYAVSLAASLIENGWEVHLFGETWDGKPEAAVFHKITIPKYLPAWLKMVLFALKHKKAVKNHAFDVIMGFGNTLYMNVYQSHGGVHWFSTKRKVYSEKSKIKRAIKRLIIILSLKQWVRAWIESAPFRLDPRPKIVAISQMIKKDMESFFKVKGSEIEVVYNGVDISRYNQDLRCKLKGPLRKQLGIKNDEVVFLFVSYDLKKKGIEQLVEAAFGLKKMGDMNFKVVVIGGLPYKTLSRRIKALNIEDKILFAGSVRSTEEYYANSDVLVLPTYYDACSLVVIEAMACGLPSITTTANGAAGIITEGKDGYIIPHPPEAQELTKKMQLLMDYEKRQEMSQEALRTGRNYSAKKNHREMIRILGEAADLNK
ncbi:MAG: glycosyltransferase family 4 protein [Deltaproteobacteria bacterium]|nr:glycosyltransferase family 4 protein [Deltaproteobacteria bacterium]MBW2663449.1 glycosyltransferase family 4 protein [Deltaproteobacteria bacterium]